MDWTVRTTRVFELLLSIFVFSFLLTIFLAGACTVPCSDDLYFYHLFLEKDFVGSMFGFSSNKRFSAHTFSNILFLLSGDFKVLLYTYPTFLLISFSASLLTIWYFLRHFFSDVIRTTVPAYRLFLLSSLIFVALYLNTTNPIEVWYWLSAHTSYFISITFLFLGSTLLLKSLSRISRYLAILSFFILGGLAENIVLTAAILLMLIIVGSYFLPSLRVYRRALFQCLVALLVLPLAQLIDGGWLIKLESTQRLPLDWSFSKKVTLAGSVKLIWLTFTILLFGSEVSKSIQLTPIIQRKIIVVTLSVLLIAICFVYIPLICVFGGDFPSRSVFGFDLFFTGCLLTLSLLVVQRLSWITRPITSIILVSAAVVLTIAFSLRRIPDAVNYRAEYSLLIDEIRSSKIDSTENCILLVDKLSDPGIIAGQNPSEYGSLDTNITSLYLAPLNGKRCLIFTRAH